MPLRLTVLLLLACLLTACAPSAAPGQNPVSAPLTTMQPDGGDSVRGEELFRLYVPEARYACISCHLPDSTQTLLGPGLRDIGVSAARCDPEQSLEDYLRESLLEPDVCLVPGYTAAVMPSVYAELWSEREINDLVAWLLTLRPST